MFCNNALSYGEQLLTPQPVPQLEDQSLPAVCDCLFNIFAATIHIGDLFLFHYLMLNMFRMLIHPSSGACDLFFELFHGLYCSGTMRVGVTVWFGWGGVVSVS